MLCPLVKFREQIEQIYEREQHQRWRRDRRLLLLWRGWRTWGGLHPLALVVQAGATEISLLGFSGRDYALPQTAPTASPHRPPWVCNKNLFDSQRLGANRILEFVSVSARPHADGPAWTSPAPPDANDWAILLERQT
jgi:hypothetical protein